MGAQAIVGAFRTVSLLVAESEAAIIPLELRFLTTQLTTWIKWHAKPSSHRFWKIKRTIDLSNKRWIFPLRKMAEKINALDLVKLEKIEAFLKAPWVPPVRVNIFDRKEAIQNEPKGFNPREPVLFTDGSVRNNAVGIGVKWMGRLSWPDVSKTVSTSQQLDPYAAELVALDSAVSYLLTSMQRSSIGPPITVFSDCKSALQALSNPFPRSEQFLITRITLKVHEISMFQQSQINFQWSPGHSEIPGNEQAHKLAQDATTITPARTDNFSQYPLLQSVALEKGRKLYLAPPPLCVGVVNQQVT